MPDGSPAWTFTFFLALFPVDENHTRLIVRESFAKGAMPPAALFAMETPDAVMELKALDYGQAPCGGRRRVPREVRLS